MIDWTRIRHFRPEEFKCSHCGASNMDSKFVKLLDGLRGQLGKQMVVSSGYRCPDHNDAVSSTGRNGPHTTGRAADIAIRGEPAYRLVKLALLLGFTGIGVNQKGNARFIHLDTLKEPRPRIWSY